MMPCIPYLSYLSYIPHIPYIWNIVTTPTMHTIPNIHAIHAIPTLHRKHSIPIIVTIHTIQTIHTVISNIPYPTDLHTIPTIHTMQTIHAIHPIPTIHTEHTILSKHAIPDRPYTPYIPNTIPHPHHTTGKEGADLIWRQYMDGTHPIGGVAGHGAYIYTHACIYICGTIIYMYIQLYIFSLSLWINLYGFTSRALSWLILTVCHTFRKEMGLETGNWILVL